MIDSLIFIPCGNCSSGNRISIVMIDVIRPSETLSFDFYLVAIGELCRDKKPTSTVNCQAKEEAFRETYICSLDLFYMWKIVKSTLLGLLFLYKHWDAWVYITLEGQSCC